MSAESATILESDLATILKEINERKGDLNSLREKIGKALNVDQREKWGRSNCSLNHKFLDMPLLVLIAIKHELLHVIELLLENRVSVTARNKLKRNLLERTLLCSAVMRNNQEIVKLLLERGADKDVDVRDVLEMTPLHVAIINDNHEIVELLLKYNADINAKSTLGDTPLHLAKAKRKEKGIRAGCCAALLCGATEVAFFTTRIVEFKKESVVAALSIVTAIALFVGYCWYVRHPYNNLFSSKLDLPEAKSIESCLTLEMFD